MSEQVKIKQAKEGGLYLLGLLFTQILVVWVVWADSNLLSLLLAFSAFSYFVYRSIAIDAFSLVVSLLPKYLKWKLLHRYFEQSSQSKFDTVKHFWSQPTTAQHQTPLQPSNEPERFYPEKHFQKVEISGISESTLNTTMVIHASKPQLSKLPPISRPSVDKHHQITEFISARDKYKQTISKLQPIGVSSANHQNLMNMLRSKYTLMAKEALKLSQSNLKEFIRVLEENFQIKLLNNFQHIPEKLEPVKIDDAIKHIKIIDRTKCLPWAEKNPLQPTSLKLIQTLTAILKQRERFDKMLNPQVEILQQQREKLVGRAKKQLEEGINGKYLLRVVSGIYNQATKNQMYKLEWNEGKVRKDSLAVVESEVAGSYHVNLKMVRGDKQMLWHLRPGENNIWYLFALANTFQKSKL